MNCPVGEKLANEYAKCIFALAIHVCTVLGMCPALGPFVPWTDCMQFHLVAISLRRGKKACRMYIACTSILSFLAERF